MLVLSRRIGEDIVIDERIRVRVTKVRGASVSLAITAPDEIPIIRGELKTDSRAPNAGTNLRPIPYLPR